MGSKCHRRHRRLGLRVPSLQYLCGVLTRILYTYKYYFFFICIPTYVLRRFYFQFTTLANVYRRRRRRIITQLH